MAPLPSGSQASQYDHDSFYARRHPSSKVIQNGPSHSSSSVSIKKKRSTSHAGHKKHSSPSHNALVKSVRMNYSPTRNAETDPFDREFQEPPSTLYICPEAPYHSNEYLMGANSHKYFEVSDLYKHINESGSMEHFMSNSDPYLTISTLQEENINLRNRIEALEARIVQLETVAAT